MTTRAAQGSQVTPREGRGQLRWNGGGWAGSVLGMSCWLVLASGLALAQADFGRAGALAACAALVVGTGVTLWRARARVAPLPAALLLLAAAFLAAVVALPLMSGLPEVAWSQGRLGDWPAWLGIFPGLALLLTWIDRRGRAA